MKKFNTIITIIASLSLLSATSFAGSGTAASPFTVCKGSQFKLTSNAYADPTTFTWTKISGDASGTAATLPSGTNVQGTYLITTTGSDAAGDTLKYSLMITSEEGCISTVQTFYVVVVDPSVNLALGAGTNDDYCQESIVAAGETINLVATSPNAGYTIPNNTYSWSVASAPATVENVNAATTTGNVTSAPGTYTFTVNTSAAVDIAPVGGCVASASVAVTINPTPSAPTVTISAD